MGKIQDKLESTLFDVITDIPDSLYEKCDDVDGKVSRLIKVASMKSASISATLSIPAGITGIMSVLPDVLAIWKIQAQLVSDIAACYGKLACLSREAMVWCLFRHSAAKIMKGLAVKTGNRLVLKSLSMSALRSLLTKIGLNISSKVFGKTFMRIIPGLGALGNGAFSYYDTREVGLTAESYFRALADQDPKPVGPEVQDAEVSEVENPEENA